MKKKEVLISLLFSTLLIVLIEFCSFLIYKPGHLDSINKILLEDKDKLWKVKNNYSANFFGEVANTDSDGFRKTTSEERWKTAKIKLAVMGASPSFGWGVKDSESYSSLLGEKLPNSVSVKNFSQIGYSSFQGHKLLKEVLKWKPTHIIFTYVINDLDYYRFFYGQNLHDSEVKTSSANIIMIRNFIKELYTPKLILSLFPKRHVDNSELRKTRVPLKSYLNNYRSMVEISKKNGIVPILVKFPVNLPTNNRFKNNKRKEENSLIAKRSLNYNNELERFSKEKGLQLIDLVKVRDSSKEYLFLDPNGDTIHPNILGHTLFAEEIFKYLSKNVL
ncbi:hypothetical protein A9Q84_19895 [Halobacteriovorax marinus]|uniref:SGNH hydrolase-type esterase domain-containing protein n=1 Tax=Halobacteriovorax marinus TaxID=97084 RepID=A0A1Y5F871_9BACT|nr:hypothetical protein A9Q84_19895 [Halobacteriovorax marinus]